MIDTVVITLNWRKDFEIQKSCYRLFSPNAAHFFEPPFIQFGHKKAIKAVCTPASQHKRSGNYMPRLTLMKAVRKGGIPTFLNVEFSVPKVVFNNNFSEVTEDSFNYLCNQLMKKLARYGVVVHDVSVIKKASVSVIHYSKNITLTDYSTAGSVLSELAKCNYTARKQSDGRKYRNNGEAVHFYSSKWGLCLYDKLREHTRAKVSEKGLFEKDSYCQLSLFDDNPLVSPFEMVRMEARYIGKAQIRKSLKVLGIEKVTPTFCNLYKESISKAMLQNEFSKLRATYPEISLSEKGAPALLSELSIQNPTTQISTIMQAIAYKTLVEKTDTRNLRKIGNFSNQQWYSLNKKINNLNFTRNELSCFDVIEEQLERFKPLRIGKHFKK